MAPVLPLQKIDALEENDVDIGALVALLSICAGSLLREICFDAYPAPLTQGYYKLLEHLIEAERVQVEVLGGLC